MAGASDPLVDDEPKNGTELQLNAASSSSEAQINQSTLLNVLDELVGVNQTSDVSNEMDVDKTSETYFADVIAAAADAAADSEDNVECLCEALAQHSADRSTFRRAVRFTFSKKWEALDEVQRQRLQLALTACSSCRLCGRLARLFPEPWGGPQFARLIRGAASAHDGEPPPPPDGDPPMRTRLGAVSCDDKPKITRLELLEYAGCLSEARELCFAYSRCTECSSGSVVVNHCRNQYLPVALKLMYDVGNVKGMIDEIEDLTCHDGLDVVQETMKFRDSSFIPMLESLTQILLVRDLYSASSFCCTLALMNLWCSLHVKRGTDLKLVESETLKLGALATSSAHLYLLADALCSQYGRSLVGLYMKLYVHAFTIDLNYLEYSRQVGCDVSVLELECHMARVYMKLAKLLAAENDLAMARECVLTAFSLEPTAKRLEVLRAWRSSLTSPCETTTTTTIVPCSGECYCEEKGLCRREAPVLFSYRRHHPSGILDSPLGLAGLVTDQMLQDLCILVEGPRVRSLTWALPWEQLEALCQRYLSRAGAHRPDACSQGASIEARLELIKQKRLSLDTTATETSKQHVAPGPVSMDIDEEDEEEYVGEQFCRLPRPARIRPASVEDYVFSDEPSAETSASPPGHMPGVQDGLSPLAGNDSPVELHLSPTNEQAEAVIEDFLRLIDKPEEAASCLDQEPVPRLSNVVRMASLGSPGLNRGSIMLLSSPVHMPSVGQNLVVGNARRLTNPCPMTLDRLLDNASGALPRNSAAERPLSADDTCSHVSAELWSIGTAAASKPGDGGCRSAATSGAPNRQFLGSPSGPGATSSFRRGAPSQSTADVHGSYHRIAVTGSGREHAPTSSTNGVPLRHCAATPSSHGRRKRDGKEESDDADGYRSRMSDEHKLFVDAVTELRSGPRFNDSASPSKTTPPPPPLPRLESPFLCHSAGATSPVTTVVARPKVVHSDSTHHCFSFGDSSLCVPASCQSPPQFLQDHLYFQPLCPADPVQSLGTLTEAPGIQLINGHAPSPDYHHEDSPETLFNCGPFNRAPIGSGTASVGVDVAVAPLPVSLYLVHASPAKLASRTNGILVLPAGDGYDNPVPTIREDIRKCAGKWTAAVVDAPRPGSDPGRGEPSPPLPPLLPPPSPPRPSIAAVVTSRKSLVESQWLSMKSKGILPPSLTPTSTVIVTSTSPSSLVPASTTSFSSTSSPSLTTVAAPAMDVCSVVASSAMHGPSAACPTPSSNIEQFHHLAHPIFHHVPADCVRLQHQVASSTDRVKQDNSASPKNGKGWVARRSAHGVMGYFKATEEEPVPKRKGGGKVANGRRAVSALGTSSWRGSSIVSHNSLNGHATSAPCVASVTTPSPRPQSSMAAITTTITPTTIMEATTNLSSVSSQAVPSFVGDTATTVTEAIRVAPNSVGTISLAVSSLGSRTSFASVTTTTTPVIAELNALPLVACSPSITTRPPPSSVPVVRKNTPEVTAAPPQIPSSATTTTSVQVGILGRGGPSASIFSGTIKGHNLMSSLKTPTSTVTKSSRNRKTVPCDECKKFFVSATTLGQHKLRYHVNAESSVGGLATSVAAGGGTGFGATVSSCSVSGVATLKKLMDEKEVNILLNVFPKLDVDGLVTSIPAATFTKQVQPVKTRTVPIIHRKRPNVTSSQCRVSSSAFVPSQGTTPRPEQNTSGQLGQPVTTIRQSTHTVSLPDGSERHCDGTTSRNAIQMTDAVVATTVSAAVASNATMNAVTVNSAQMSTTTVNAATNETLVPVSGCQTVVITDCRKGDDENHVLSFCDPSAPPSISTDSSTDASVVAPSQSNGHMDSCLVARPASAATPKRRTDTQGEELGAPPNVASRGRVSSRKITPSPKRSCSCCLDVGDASAKSDKKCKTDRDKTIRKQANIKPPRIAVPQSSMRPLMS